MANLDIEKLIPDAAKQDLIDINELLNKSVENVTKLADISRTVRIGVEDSKNMSAYTSNIKAATTANKEYATSVLTLAKAKTEESKERLNNAKAAQVEEKIKQQNNKASIDEEKIIKELANEYKILNKALAEAQDKYRQYALVLGKNHPLSVQAKSDAAALSQQLKSLDAEVGVFTKNVGNYNGVGANFNQLLRELPNAGISARTFIQAIGNNVSYFVEAVKIARNEGQSWGQILKTMASSAFGLVGVVNIAVAIFTAFGDKLFETEDKAKKTKSAIDSLSDSVDNYVESLKKQNTQIENSINVGSRELKRQAELAKAKGDTVKAFKLEQEARQSDLKDLNGYADKLDRITKEIQATYSDDKFNSTLKDRLAPFLTEEEIQTIAENLSKGIDVVSVYNDKAAAIRQEAADKANEIETASAAYQKKLNDDAAKDWEKRREERQKALEEWRKLRERDFTAQYESQKKALEIEAENFKKQSSDEKLSMSNRSVALASYYEIKQTLIIEAAEYEKMHGAKTAEEIKQIDKQKNDALAQLNQEALDADLDMLADHDKKQKEAIKKSAEEQYKIKKEYAEKEKALKEKLNEAEKELALDFVSFEQGIAELLLSSKTKRLNQEQADLEAKHDLDVARIEATATSEKDAAEKKYALEQNLYAQKEKLAADQKKLDKDRFTIEKAAALANLWITANAQVAKIQGEAAVLASNPVTATLAATALAQIPFVYGSAALAAGLIAAQIIAYGEGTEYHPGGPALIGERYSPELVIEPGKMPFWVDQPQIFPNLAMGSQVIPIEKMADRAFAPVLQDFVIQTKPNNSAAIDTEKIVSAIKGIPSSSLTIERGVIKQAIKKGNSRLDYLNRNILD